MCTEVKRLYEMDSEEAQQSRTSALEDPARIGHNGMDADRWRERVRQAGRRVIAFPKEGEDRFECVQSNKAVEPSFAKGDWAVRHVKE